MRKRNPSCASVISAPEGEADSDALSEIDGPDGLSDDEAELDKLDDELTLSEADGDRLKLEDGLGLAEIETETEALPALRLTLSNVTPPGLLAFPLA